MNTNLKLDIFPQEFFERMKALADRKPSLVAHIKRWMHIPVLWDLDARLKMMDQFDGYRQILTLSLPPIEFLAQSDESPEIARRRRDRE